SNYIARAIRGISNGAGSPTNPANRGPVRKVSEELIANVFAAPQLLLLVRPVVSPRCPHTGKPGGPAAARCSWRETGGEALPPRRADHHREAANDVLVLSGAAFDHFRCKERRMNRQRHSFMLASAFAVLALSPRIA